MAPHPIRLLVHLPNWIGDGVMALPAIAAAAATPGYHVTLLGRRNPLLISEGIPGVVDRRPIPQRPPFPASLAWLAGVTRGLPGRFDVAVTMSPSLSSAWVVRASGAPTRVGWTGQGRSPLLTTRWKRKRRGRIHLRDEFIDLMRSIGVSGPFGPPRIRFSEEERARGRERLSPWGDVPVAAVAPGARFGSAKRWPIRRFQALAHHLLESGFGVVWLGGAGEKGMLAEWMAGMPRGAPVLDVMGSMDVRESAALMSCCAVAVANDSGAMHLAQAAGCPTVALFGSTDPRWTGPSGAATVLRHQVFCSPCFRRVCPYELECWEGIEVGEVVSAALALATAEREVV